MNIRIKVCRGPGSFETKKKFLGEKGVKEVRFQTRHQRNGVRQVRLIGLLKYFPENRARGKRSWYRECQMAGTALSKWGVAYGREGRSRKAD